MDIFMYRKFCVIQRQIPLPQLFPYVFKLAIHWPTRILLKPGTSGQTGSVVMKPHKICLRIRYVQTGRLQCSNENLSAQTGYFMSALKTVFNVDIPCQIWTILVHALLGSLGPTCIRLSLNMIYPGWVALLESPWTRGMHNIVHNFQTESKWRV